ncbi:hypothetical protein LFL96_19770 [Paraburkholderia sp. D15]|uniref:hypothetical protein n=1 Tax=Paraburkholderia sp. D15 TaxID=2880218 RepID=UPI00247AC082|nr:hypothetical protein [Paraburkholderia sp. D15]WGS53315.1 hypothetical protein LFL96_19770 [Paraburkholderia sp. D15]WKF61237.1 hypothetical protein HUO10_005768 [Paraburkholderia busanensis]
MTEPPVVPALPDVLPEPLRAEPDELLETAGLLTGGVVPGVPPTGGMKPGATGLDDTSRGTEPPPPLPPVDLVPGKGVGLALP